MGEVHSGRPVVGYADLYTVDDIGVVVSLRSGNPLKPWITPKGYAVVCLCRDGVESRQYVHRLVASAFIGPSNGLHVNHKDGDKANNRPANLEWVTVRENNAHAKRMGLRKTSYFEAAKRSAETRRQRRLAQVSPNQPAAKARVPG